MPLPARSLEIPQPVRNEPALPLARIVLDPSWQPRQALDQKAVRRYATAYQRGATFPPLAVAEVGAGFVLLDGWHRHAALTSLGREYAAADIFHVKASEAPWVSAKLNLRRGDSVKPKKADLRRSFRFYVDAGHHMRNKRQYKNYRQMEADFDGAVSHTSLHRWMRDDYPEIFAAMGRTERLQPFTPTAGKTEATPRSDQDDLAARAADYVNMASTIFGVLHDKRSRRTIAEAVYELAELVKTEGLYAPAEPEDF